MFEKLCEDCQAIGRKNGWKALLLVGALSAIAMIVMLFIVVAINQTKYERLKEDFTQFNLWSEDRIKSLAARIAYLEEGDPPTSTMIPRDPNRPPLSSNEAGAAPAPAIALERTFDELRQGLSNIERRSRELAQEVYKNQAAISALEREDANTQAEFNHDLLSSVSDRLEEFEERNAEFNHQILTEIHDLRTRSQDGDVDLSLVWDEIYELLSRMDMNPKWMESCGWNYRWSSETGEWTEYDLGECVIP